MSYALNDMPDTSIEKSAEVAAKAPKILIDASTGNIPGSVREKGLILTKEQIIDLYLYEQKGLNLPTAAADVSAYLGYDEGYSPGQGLAVGDFIKTFSTIKSHAGQWNGLRLRIKLISSELKIFAATMINTGKHMTTALDAITALKVLKEYGIKTLADLRRVEQEVGDKFPGIRLDEDDAEAVTRITYFLDELQKKIAAQERQTEALKVDLDRFSAELATTVRPEIAVRLVALENHKLDEEVRQLQTEISEITKEIDEKNATYKQMVMDSVKSAINGGLIGLGMAIYVGTEAEKVRKERNALKKKRDAKNEEMGFKSTVLKRLNQVKADLQDLEFLSLQADAATQNLVFTWNVLSLYVAASAQESRNIDDALKVNLLAFHFDQVVEPWTQILTDADKLYAVFAEADQEIKNRSF
jgi:hypothetical protein